MKHILRNKTQKYNLQVKTNHKKTSNQLIRFILKKLKI